MDPEEPSETMHEFETLEGEVRKKKKRPSAKKKKSSRSIAEGDAPPTPRKKKKKKRSVVLNEEESEEISNRKSFAENPIKEPTSSNEQGNEDISDDAFTQKPIKKSFVSDECISEEASLDEEIVDMPKKSFVSNKDSFEEATLNDDADNKKESFGSYEDLRDGAENKPKKTSFSEDRESQDTAKKIEQEEDLEETMSLDDDQELVPASGKKGSGDLKASMRASLVSASSTIAKRSSEAYIPTWLKKLWFFWCECSEFIAGVLGFYMTYVVLFDLMFGSDESPTYYTTYTEPTCAVYDSSGYYCLEYATAAPTDGATEEEKNTSLIFIYLEHSLPVILALGAAKRAKEAWNLSNWNDAHIRIVPALHGGMQYWSELMGIVYSICICHKCFSDNDSKCMAMIVQFLAILPLLFVSLGSMVYVALHACVTWCVRQCYYHRILGVTFKKDPLVKHEKEATSEERTSITEFLDMSIEVASELMTESVTNFVVAIAMVTIGDPAAFQINLVLFEIFQLLVDTWKPVSHMVHFLNDHVRVVSVTSVPAAKRVDLPDGIDTIFHVYNKNPQRAVDVAIALSKRIFDITGQYPSWSELHGEQGVQTRAYLVVTGFMHQGEYFEDTGVTKYKFGKIWVSDSCEVVPGPDFNNSAGESVVTNELVMH